MILYGLIGNPISHSASAVYFKEKFIKEHIHGKDYRLFPLSHISDLHSLLADNPEIHGLNVTIPFKEQVLPFLDEIDSLAGEIGAVNTIKIFNAGNKICLKGYNTDCHGFLQSADFSGYKNALILGTGGSAKAVAYALTSLNIGYRFVSRQPGMTGILAYTDLSLQIMKAATLIINATPSGQFPETGTCPPLPYQFLSDRHFLYDLVYNPEKTLFLSNGLKQGCRIQNGKIMLHQQAELAYQIWQEGE